MESPKTLADYPRVIVPFSSPSPPSVLTAVGTGRGSQLIPGGTLSHGKITQSLTVQSHASGYVLAAALRHNVTVRNIVVGLCCLSDAVTAARVSPVPQMSSTIRVTLKNLHDGESGATMASADASLMIASFLLRIAVTSVRGT